MTEENTNNPTHETQQERWLKYGANVTVATVVVVLLAVAVVYLAEKKPWRIDTTMSHIYSLKPQTISIIEDNKQPITIISLYSDARKPQDPSEAEAESTPATDVDRAAVVADLLQEYQSRGHGIQVQTIDPVRSPTKVDDLIAQVEEQYGGEIKKYKTFAGSVKAKYDAIAKLADGETDRIRGLPLNEIQSDDVARSVVLALQSVSEVPEVLKQGQEVYTRMLKKKLPDYKGISDSVSQNMTQLSEIMGGVIDGFTKSKDDKAVPPAIRQYMTDSLPKYVEIKKQADGIVGEIKGLGELKLDTLRDALNQHNPILVRGETEWRVIPEDKVWKTDPQSMRGGDVAAKPRFAGEQQITTAILSLDQPAKPKVCFVRAGGPPITDPGGRLNSVADRLRDYNFDVSEKDLSGTYAMQAMQQQQEAAPEPSDDQIADAVWVVDGLPPQSNPMMGGPPPSVAGKVADHLTKGFHWENGKKVPGGSAFCLFTKNGDNMSSALAPFGVTARTDAVAVHSLIKAEGAPEGGIVEQAPRIPFIFVFSQWGDSVITSKLDSLLGVLYQACPIQVTPVKGVVSTSLVPVPGAPDYPACWGETDLSTIENEPKFHKDSDLSPPLFAGAMAEQSGQRVVCMGSEVTFVGSSADIFNQNVVDLPDGQLLQKTGVITPQFPGSADFFMNSVFWLSHQESLIAISPAAMNVSRISSMSGAALGFWRIGVLLIGLPGLVLLAGAGVWLSRRD